VAAEEAGSEVIRPLKVVALDISQKATAIAATHDPHGEPFLGVFTIPGTAGRPLHEQVDAIEAKVRRSCGRGSDRKVWRPDVVTIEGTFDRPDGHNSNYALHALHAVIKQWLYRRGIPYVDVSPSKVKLWATGSGATRGVNKVTKDKVIAAVLATYGRLLTINPADDNQCDAVAALSMTLHAYGQPLTTDTTSHQRRALNDVVWPQVDWSRP
jgi:crossover junction endodeoxyribonuclease RuvC